MESSETPLENSKTKNQILSIHDKCDQLEIVSEINEYFAQIGEKLANDIPESNIPLNFGSNPTIPFLHLRHTTPKEVDKYLKSIFDSKAMGEDGILIRFIEMTSNITAPLICHIINMTFDTSIIPLGWKHAVITLLYKEGDRNLASNYRPISILSAISKIMGKMVHSQVYEHLRVHNLLSEAQFGFRKYHSTATCMLQLMDIIYKNIDGGLLTGVIFLDLKKAFDTVDHNILLQKLHIFNLSENSITWFRNYLTGRVQAVKSNG